MMLDYKTEKLLKPENIMKTFFTKIAGQEGIKIGNYFYTLPLNYETDTEKKVICEELNTLNLKGKNLERLQKALVKYVNVFFESDRDWANPIVSCYSNEDKLIHSMHTLFLNLTNADYDDPVKFVERYIDFLTDQTFEDLRNGKNISKVSSLDDCDILVELAEQKEFQETPNAMIFTIKKGGIEKRMPRIAFGIEGDKDKTAYIYGIQGYHEKDNAKEIKRVNRKRYEVNKRENYPHDYIDVYLKQEPYAYTSLFIFLDMLKQKGITKIAMPAFLPERYEERQIRLNKKYANEHSKNAEKRLSHEASHYQRIQYNTSQKFLAYMIRMTCELSGIEITQYPDDDLGFLAADISKMNTTNKTNPIFLELNQKVKELIPQKNMGEVDGHDR